MKHAPLQTRSTDVGWTFGHVDRKLLICMFGRQRSSLLLCSLTLQEFQANGRIHIKVVQYEAGHIIPCVKSNICLFLVCL